MDSDERDEQKQDQVRENSVRDNKKREREQEKDNNLTSLPYHIILIVCVTTMEGLKQEN